MRDDSRFTIRRSPLFMEDPGIHIHRINQDTLMRPNQKVPENSGYSDLFLSCILHEYRIKSALPFFKLIAVLLIGIEAEAVAKFRIRQFCHILKQSLMDIIGADCLFMSMELQDQFLEAVFKDNHCTGAA